MSVQAYAFDVSNVHSDHYALRLQMLLIPSPQDGVEVTSLSRVVSHYNNSRKFTLTVDSKGDHKKVSVGGLSLVLEKDARDVLDHWSGSFVVANVKKVSLTEEELSSLSMYKTPKTLIERVGFNLDL